MQRPTAEELFLAVEMAFLKACGEGDGASALAFAEARARLRLVEGTVARTGSSKTGAKPRKDRYDI